MLGEEDRCFICGYGGHLDCHHAFEGGTSGRRQRSDKRELTVMLCRNCHNEVHAKPNQGKDLFIKQTAQKYYEENIGTRDDFRREFIKSYL